MPTRLEKLDASLKREQHKADLKRLKKAKEYFDLGLKVIQEPFFNPAITVKVSVAFDGIDEHRTEIERIITEQCGNPGTPTPSVVDLPPLPARELKGGRG